MMREERRAYCYTPIQGAKRGKIPAFFDLGALDKTGKICYNTNDVYFIFFQFFISTTSPVFVAAATNSGHFF